MHNWQSALIKSSSSFREALEIIDSSALQVGLVVDETGRLLGMVTDGTIRRAILRGVSMEENISQVMFTAFRSASITDGREQILATMRREKIRHIPILDEQGIIRDLKILIDFFTPSQRDNPVVLMAGGMGTRLRPLTESCPKPLLKVGEKPILETILEGFLAQGFWKFYFSVNYCADMIKEHFNDGSEWGANITYLEEDKPLGTAGALSLLPESPSLPFIVMNGDLLTKVDYKKLLDFHTKQGSLATMCIREHHYQIPYGVVTFDGPQFTGMQEKPTQNFFVNAGIYALSPKTIALIPKDQFFDMPSLFSLLNDKAKKTAVFPIHEYWLDIGQMNDFARANNDYATIFNSTQND